MKGFAIIEMVGGQPNVDFTITPISGYVLGAERGTWGLYLVAGTAAQLTALVALSNVYRVCTLDEIDNVITSTRRTKVNEWCTAQGWPNVPAGWTYRQIILWAYKRANPGFDYDKFYLVDG